MKTAKTILAIIAYLAKTISLLAIAKKIFKNWKSWRSKEQSLRDLIKALNIIILQFIIDEIYSHLELPCESISLKNTKHLIKNIDKINKSIFEYCKNVTKKTLKMLSNTKPSSSFFNLIPTAYLILALTHFKTLIASFKNPKKIFKVFLTLNKLINTNININKTK